MIAEFWLLFAFFFVFCICFFNRCFGGKFLKLAKSLFCVVFKNALSGINLVGAADPSGRMLGRNVHVMRAQQLGILSQNGSD